MTSAGCALETVLTLYLNLMGDVEKDADPAGILGQVRVPCLALLKKVLPAEDGSGRLFSYETSMLETLSMPNLQGN